MQWFLAAAMLLMAAVAPPLCHGQMVVNEIMWMGTDLSTADEWVELLSTAPDAADLSGWTLTSLDGSGNEAVLVRFGTGTIVPPGATFLIANYGAAASRLAVEPHVVTSSTSLPNTKLLLRLRSSTGAIVDTADDGVGTPFAGTNAAGPWGKASMERINPLASGALRENWRTAQTFRGFDDGARLFGTPGFMNGSGPSADTQPPAEATNLAGAVVSSSTGTSLQLLWQPSTSLDLASQLLRLQPEDGTGSLQALDPTAHAWSVDNVDPHASYAVRLQSRDDRGNTSTGVLLTVQPSTGIGSGTGSARLQISEMLPDPPGSDADEWIEVANAGDAPADLHEYRLSVGTTAFQLSGALLPGTARLFPHSQSKIALRNAGDTVRLYQGTALVDELTYPALPEGVSFGRLPGEAAPRPFCVPTPGAPNVLPPWTPQVVVQSGELEAMGKTSVNLMVTGGNGTLAGGTCHIDFGDGSTAESCNPPSHAFPREGIYSVSIQATNYCGTTVLQSLQVRVDPQSSRKVTAATVARCLRQTASGVTINEFLPNPEGDERQGEWVELANETGDDVDLCGWWLDDEEGGSKPFALAGQRIEAHGTLLIRRRTSGITLDNDADRIRLLATATGSEIPTTGDTRNKRVVQEIAYDHAPSQRSFALRSDGVFVWTPYPTPGDANRFVDTDVPYGSNAMELSALPRPGNGRQASQWIGITNRTDKIVILSGWSIRSSRAKQKPFAFDYRFISPHERIILKGEETGLDLKKTDTLQLVDHVQRLVSTLHWQNAGVNAEYAWKPTEQESVTVMTVRPSLDMTLLTEDGTIKRRNVACIDVESEYFENVISLLKGKKFELQKYSTLVQHASFEDLQTPARDSLTASLLRRGYGILSDDCSAEYRAQFEPFESFARSSKSGVWANDEQARAIDARRNNAKVLSMLRRDGLRLSVAPKESVLHSGSGVRIATNAPAQVYVSLNGGEYRTYSGAVAIAGQTSLRAYAIASVPSGTGAVAFHSATVSRFFVQERQRYDHLLAFSEVYPSPLTFGSYRHLNEEWIELENLSNHPVNLGGWAVADATKKKPKTMPATWSIPAHGRRILRASDLSISLNNDGDFLTLLDPLHNKVDHIKYTKISKGMAVQRSTRNGVTVECTGVAPTPGARNSCQPLATGKGLLDADHDLLTDDQELLLYRTNPHAADSDGDGWIDSFEIENGMNPVIREKHPIYRTDSYKKFILKKMAMKWAVLKTKGLKVTGKTAPVSALELILDSGKAVLVPIKEDGSFAYYLNQRIGSGSHDISLRVRDVSGRWMELPNALRFELEKSFVPKVRAKSARKAISRKSARSTPSALPRVPPLKEWEGDRSGKRVAWDLLAVAVLGLAAGLALARYRLVKTRRNANRLFELLRNLIG